MESAETKIPILDNTKLGESFALVVVLAKPRMTVEITVSIIWDHQENQLVRWSILTDSFSVESFKEKDELLLLLEEECS